MIGTEFLLSSEGQAYLDGFAWMCESWRQGRLIGHAQACAEVAEARRRLEAGEAPWQVIEEQDRYVNGT